MVAETVRCRRTQSTLAATIIRTTLSTTEVGVQGGDPW